MSGISPGSERNFEKKKKTNNMVFNIVRFCGVQGLEFFTVLGVRIWVLGFRVLGLTFFLGGECWEEGSNENEEYSRKYKNMFRKMSRRHTWQQRQLKQAHGNSGDAHTIVHVCTLSEEVRTKFSGSFPR